MSSIVYVRCINCSRLFDLPLKIYNQSSKHNWKFYCSSKCLKLYKSTGKFLECSNRDCSKRFYRRPSDISNNNFCSSSCAAKTINRTNVKRKKRFNICANPVCGKQIFVWRKYCSADCERAVFSKSIPLRKYEVINFIKLFVYSHDRIPFKSEVRGIYVSARKAFGTWNKAVVAAGFQPNPVKFANKCIAKDGHKCDSLSEKIIDDWLFSHGVEHKVHIPYPDQKRFTSDFLVGNVWIEFFGIYGINKRYTILADQKIKLIRKHKLKFIKIFPKDLFSEVNFNKKMLQLLISK